MREQFEADLRALTEAEQDSKELKSAKQRLLYDRIVETVALPFPTAPAGAEGRDALTKPVGREGRRVALQGARAAQDRCRQAPARRSLQQEIRPIAVEVSVSPRTHGSALFTRGQTQTHVAR